MEEERTEGKGRREGNRDGKERGQEKERGERGRGERVKGVEEEKEVAINVHPGMRFFRLLSEIRPKEGLGKCQFLSFSCSL